MARGSESLPDFIIHVQVESSQSARNMGMTRKNLAVNNPPVREPLIESWEEYNLDQSDERPQTDPTIFPYTSPSKEATRKVCFARKSK